MLSRSFLRLRLATPVSARTFVSTAARDQFSKLTLIGRMRATPEQITGKSGNTFYKYTLACNKNGPQDTPPGERHVSWYDVIYFAEDKDFMLDIRKGTLCYLEADVTIRTYDDKNGQKQKRWDIVQRRLLQISKPKDAEEMPHEEYE
ncbi:ssDNA binding protein [Geopyxis carbonaria]|nr:ssDNA binding protein [Geopyxis carbonaria]